MVANTENYIKSNKYVKYIFLNNLLEFKVQQKNVPQMRFLILQIMIFMI